MIYTHSHIRREKNPATESDPTLVREPRCCADRKASHEYFVDFSTTFLWKCFSLYLGKKLLPEVKIFFVGIEKHVGLHHHRVVGGGAVQRGDHCPEHLDLWFVGCNTGFWGQKLENILQEFNNPAELPVVVFTKDASKLGLNKMKEHIRHISVAEPHNKMSTTKQAIKKTNLPTSVSLSSSPYGHFSCHN